MNIYTDESLDSEVLELHKLLVNEEFCDLNTYKLFRKDNRDFHIVYDGSIEKWLIHNQELLCVEKVDDELKLVSLNCETDEDDEDDEEINDFVNMCDEIKRLESEIQDKDFIIKKLNKKINQLENDLEGIKLLDTDLN